MPFDPEYVDAESEDDIDPLWTAAIDNRSVEHN
jgi:hypothetical protein